MEVNDYGKLILQLAILGALVVLRITGSITTDFTQVSIGVMVGYMFGNGVNAVRKQAPSPVLVTSRDRLDNGSAADNAA